MAADLLTLAQGMSAVGTGGVIVALAYLARPLALEALQQMRTRREQIAAEQAELRARIERAEQAERECLQRMTELSDRVSRTEEATLQVQGIMDDPEQWARMSSDRRGGKPD